MSLVLRPVLPLLALLALAVAAVSPDDARAASKRPSGKKAAVEQPVRPFAPDSPWNARVARDTPLTPDSASLVANLVQQVADFAPWIPTTKYGTPVYRVGADQPTVRVTPETGNRVLTAAWAAVPLPADAIPAQGTDASLVVYQPATDTLWEFWRLRKAADGWRATFGGRMDGVSRSSGVFPKPYGTSASGMALLGGLITPEEVAAGEIRHALAMGVPRVAPHFVAPATDTDGKTPGGIPLGTHFRLDPSLDVASLGLPRTAAIIAVAAQRYGAYVRDTSGAVPFYAQDPVTYASDPWPALFDRMTPSRLLARFPWRHMQVVAP